MLTSTMGVERNFDSSSMRERMCSIRELDSVLSSVYTTESPVDSCVLNDTNQGVMFSFLLGLG